MEKKNNWFAGASFILPGLGQIMQEKIGRAYLFLLAYVFMLRLVFVYSPYWVFGMLTIQIFSVLDAMNRVNYN